MDARQQQQIRAMRTINAQAGACSLPIELFTEFFLFAQSIWPPQREEEEMLVDNSPPLYLSGWMTVLHVCSTWRKVALSVPMLWQYIDVLGVHPDSAHDLLARSAGLPLRLKCVEWNDTQSENDEHTILSLHFWFSAAVLRRVEALYAHCYGRNRLVRELLMQEARNIRCLVFISEVLYGIQSNPPGFACPPQLRELYLSSCTIPLNFALFVPALTHLTLKSVDLATNEDQSPIERASLILSSSALFGLKYLHLSHFPLWDGRGALTQKVILPSGLDYMLMDVYIGYGRDRDAFADLLVHFSVPTTTDLNVNVHLWEAVDRLMCLYAFNVIFAKILGDNICIELALENLTQWYFYLWDSTKNTRMEGRSIHFVSRRDSVQICDFLTYFSPARPRSLSISTHFWQRTLRKRSHNAHSKTVVDIFSAASDVCCLTIHYHDHGYLSVLLGEGCALLPHLETITITSVCYPELDMEDEERVDVDYDFVVKTPKLYEWQIDTSTLPALVSGLTEVVESRRQMVTPIQLIRIEGMLAEWDGWDEVRSEVDVIQV